MLDPKAHKNIILSSLKFLVDNHRIWLYGYVIMPNHVHFLWRKQDAWINKSIAQNFLKYTAQQIKFNLLAHYPLELSNYKSTQKDRQYHFWERRPHQATMENRIIVEQKLEYIHNNPIRKNLCKSALDYPYSSARFYQTGEQNNLLTHYMEHIW